MELVKLAYYYCFEIIKFKALISVRKYFLFLFFHIFNSGNYLLYFSISFYIFLFHFIGKGKIDVDVFLKIF